MMRPFEPKRRTPVVCLTEGPAAEDQYHSRPKDKAMVETTHKRPPPITRTDYVLVAVAAVTWLLCTFGTLLS